MTPRLPPAIGDGSVATPRIGTRSARDLGMAAGAVEDVCKRSAFGAAWSVIEGRSPFFARRLLTPAELPEQISIARRSLARLRKVGSRVRQHVQAEARVAIRSVGDVPRTQSFDEEEDGVVAT